MPNEKLTEIAVILDRSGSMESIRADMDGGYASFIAEQRKVEGECVVSLYQFDTVFETVFEARRVDDVGPLGLSPRGGTALLDAMGKAIGLIGGRFKALPEGERPGSVIVLVITDGAENRSVEFTREQVKKMVEHQRDKYDWQFAFLGANIDSFAEARSLGFDGAAVMDFAPSGAGVRGMSVASSNAVAMYRKAKFEMVEQGVVGPALRSAKLDLGGDKDEKKS